MRVDTERPANVERTLDEVGGWGRGRRFGVSAETIRRGFSYKPAKL
jgi:hypothetical protein